MMLDNPERTSRGEGSADLQPVDGESCPTCHELFDLFMLRHVAVAIFDEARRAHEMHGRWCGVLLTDPRSLSDDSSRLLVKIEASRRLGYHLDVRPIRELKEIAGVHQAHKQSAEVLRYLDIPLMDSEVHVLAVWKGCVGYVIVSSNSSVCLNLLADKARRPFDNDYMRSHLLAPKEPMVEKLHQDEPAKVVLEPSRAAKPADATPAMAQRPSKPETLTLDPRLVRMVLRVHPELQEDLINISDRLYDETRLEYSYAAIFRGLIALGLASIDGKASLAVEFAGARVPRGRKRGERWRSSNTKDE